MKAIRSKRQFAQAQLALMAERPPASGHNRTELHLLLRDCEAMVQGARDYLTPGPKCDPELAERLLVRMARRIGEAL